MEMSKYGGRRDLFPVLLTTILLLGILFLHAGLDLVFDVGASSVEFTDPFTQSTHQFRDLATSEEQQDSQEDDDPFTTAGQA